MASNLGRLFSSTTITKAEPLTRSAINSVRRLLCSSASQSQPNQNNPSKEQTEPIKESIENQAEEEEEDDGDEDDGSVNKETGEVGGPRGPEPTRFGDWERNGRCSDF